MGDFNSDMDLYLSRRKKDTVASSGQTKSTPQKFLNFIYGETKVEEANDEEFEKEFEGEKEINEEEKSGIFQKLKSWFSPESDDEEDFEEIEAQKPAAVHEDIKEVLKLQNKWLSKLPSKTIKEFKESDDFKKIRELLDKHNLIKK